jgi:choice-of-anchor A domain-containing protein
MPLSKIAMVGALFAGSVHAANANTTDAVTLLNNYNLITSANLGSTSEMDGNALIGGNLYGGSNYHIHDTSTAVSALTVAGDIVGNATVNGPGLNVGGNIAGSVNMNGGGNAYVGSVSGNLNNNANGSGSTYVVGNISGNVSTNSGNTVYGGQQTGNASANGSGTVQHQTVTPPFNPATQVADAITTLSEFSNQLTSITANSSYGFTGNKAVFNAVGNGDGLAVFTISDANSFFSQANEFEFNFTGGAQRVLFNVINSDVNAALNIHANFLADAANQWGSKFLWNFENATSIAISAQFGGSILALSADVGTSANIEGTLVAQNVLQGAEIHSRPLDGGFANSIPTAVPVPGAAPLFLSALAGFGAWGRRVRKAA